MGKFFKPVTNVTDSATYSAALYKYQLKTVSDKNYTSDYLPGDYVNAAYGAFSSSYNLVSTADNGVWMLMSRSLQGNCLKNAVRLSVNSENTCANYFN